MAMGKAQKSLVQMLVLVLVAAGIGAYAYYGVHQKEAQEEKQKEAASKAFDFDKAKVKSVSLSAKGDSVVAEKDGEGWKITQPVQARADKGAIDAIVDKFADLKSRESVADNQSNLAEFGLDKPRAAATLTLDDGKTLELKVGDENSFDQSLYFTRSGDAHVLLGDSGLKYPLEKGLFDLRDKAIVTHEDKDVQALRVEGNGVAWAAERDGAGWKLTAPVQDKADTQALEGVLAKVKSARAKAFAAEQSPADAAQLKQWGLDKPQLVVTFQLGADRAKKTLEIGEVPGAEKKAYARLVEGGPVAEVEASLAADLAKPLADLRDKTIAAFDREQVRSLEIVPAGGEKLVVTRTKTHDADASFDTEQFALSGKSEKPKTWKLSSALYTLSALKGAALADEKATDLAKYGLDAPRLTYVVAGEGGKELARLLVGKETGTRSYAMQAGSGRVYEVEKTTVDELPKTLADVAELPPAPAAGADGGPAKSAASAP